MSQKSTFFIDGAISPQFIADSIAKHSSKTNIGAHDIFLGQVRNDLIQGKEVIAIDYSSFEEMAISTLSEIRETMFSKYNLSCLHVYHSKGLVKVGEICLFVFVSSKHRKDAFDACRDLVEEIKHKIPIFGKEVFEDETFTWKKNIL
ncbi:MAG: molybdenum cofactor biosynthesis protein MoaE [Bacteroidota bacterium]